MLVVLFNRRVTQRKLLCATLRLPLRNSAVKKTRPLQESASGRSWKNEVVLERGKETVQNSVSGEKFITFTKNRHESMKGKKKEDFDCHNFEQQAIKAMYEGKSLEQALVPLLKRLAA